MSWLHILNYPWGWTETTNLSIKESEIDWLNESQLHKTTTRRDIGCWILSLRSKGDAEAETLAMGPNGPAAIAGCREN